jgi:hypothetical protein
MAENYARIPDSAADDDGLSPTDERVYKGALTAQFSRSHAQGWEFAK